MDWRDIWLWISGRRKRAPRSKIPPRGAKPGERRTPPRAAMRGVSIFRPRSAAKTEDGSSDDHFDWADIGLALLGFASGSMDALAFFSLGAVFPSAMTGNTALLGLALGQGRWGDALFPLAAFAGFVLGAGTATGLQLRLEKLPSLRAVCSLVVLETCLLTVFALTWLIVDRPISAAWLYGLIVIASSAMGIQSVAARQVGRPGVTTIVFTSTLATIVTAATSALLRPPHRLSFATLRQIAMFLIYGVGAATSGLFASHGSPVPFMPFVAALGALAFHLRA